MKTFKYIFLLVLILGTAGACLVDDTEEYAANSTGLNLATFEKNSLSLTVLANGEEYNKTVQLKLVGPTKMNLTSDITVTVEADDASTAVDGVHYRIDNPTITLSAENNYLANLVVTLITEGNTPPMDGTPELEDYVAPVLLLDIVSATGDSKVTASGKEARVVLNFTSPNPWAGDYISEMRYFHPTAGGVYPTEPYGGVRLLDKTLEPVTGRKAETWFAVWEDNNCWITVNLDNSITFVVGDSFTSGDVKMGDPNDPTKVSHFDPVTGNIYLYYYYAGTGGNRIFWEILIPQF